ncbi:DUF2807 domain-containing protein [Capnocytophaga catalasegens]|uniref:Putative auto-transporter adhesin head GIN domain-containing protein n=1 Tax=Capnocytophaga catalasegens TaxID=1004260 RepID=A0AAV5AU68_9FLAO|nr:DUF2807 domain-containing protein [Capnocytophaga catalasegens]GIZ15031.1 hypothetical protein RCZ03_10310 [Capnocytophaga catalasegens]GJM49411.1 hypothetical protein RCZ15_03860 [Capnocytophaga catalasegens]GJM52561.1 hypothetical protein RCZ16_08780 [Capnocytophaga catalasegens]
MKKIVFFLVLVVIFCTTNAFNSSDWNEKSNEQTETRSIKGYSKILIEGGFEVILTDEAQGEIKVVANQEILSWIHTKLEGNTLHCYLDSKKKIQKLKKITIYIPSQAIDGVNLIGTGIIKTDKMLVLDQLTCLLNGAGKMNLTIKTTNLTASLKGSGSIHLDGTSESSNLKIRGVGSINTENLISENVNVSLHGVGSITTYAEKNITGELKGIGTLNIKGNPKNNRVEKFGIGKISIIQ